MINGRLFTFGCSFTKYIFPTWADILGREFEYFENWGKMGAGNIFIANQVIESSIQNKFTNNDTVVIMWANVMREDRYVNTWYNKGSVFKAYTEDFCKRFVTVRGSYIRDMALIKSTQGYLDSIGCRYEFLSVVDFDDLDVVDIGPYDRDTRKNFKIDDVLDFYKDTVSKIKPSVFDVIFNKDWNSRKLPGYQTRSDLHPTPSEHLEYLDKVLPFFPISQHTRDLIKDPNAGWKFDNNVPKHVL